MHEQEPPNDPQAEALWQINETMRPNETSLTAQLNDFFAQEAAAGMPESRYYAVGSDGTTRPRDPLTHQVLYPGDVPPSLLVDPEINAGFKFWERHAGEVSMQVLLTEHSRYGDIARAGIDLKGIATRLARKDGLLFIEGAMSQEDAVAVVDTMQAMAAGQCLPRGLADSEFFGTPPEKILAVTFTVA